MSKINDICRQVAKDHGGACAVAVYMALVEYEPGEDATYGRLAVSTLKKMQVEHLNEEVDKPQG